MPTTDEPLSSWIATAAREMQGQAGAQATLEAAVRLATDNIAGAESVGVSIVSGRTVATPAWVGQMALDCDRLQYELDEGPCLGAIARHGTVISPSVAYDDRWPRWGPRVAEEAGVASVLAVWLFTDRDSLGALNMYSSVKDAFTSHDREEALALAAHVSIALSAVRESDSLHEGLDSRSVIGQAMGIVMERYGLTSAVAFALLTRLSSSGEVKLRDLAQEVVTSRKLPGE